MSPPSNSGEESKRNKKSLKKKHRRKRRYSRSSSSNDTSGDEGEVWVEKTVLQPGPSNREKDEAKAHETVKREDWMNLNSILPCVFNPSNEEKKALRNVENSKSVLDEPGQSKRELNPYWKNGGDGLPQTEVKSNIGPTMDVNWLKKSLQRAREQAESEGKSLHEIAAQRWGSLEAIETMIAKAEQTAASRYTKSTWDNRQKYRSEGQTKSRNSGSRRNRYSRSRSRSRDRSERYKRNDSPSFQRKEKKFYKKCTDDDCFTYTSDKTYHRQARNWKKEKPRNEIVDDQPKLTSSEPKTSSVKTDQNTNRVNVFEDEPITEVEMNKLGARIVKAEIMGDLELAAELKMKLEKARKHFIKPVTSRETEQMENVILSRTDAKGISRPLEPRSNAKESAGSSRKRKNVPTHVSGERVRHYFDDDKYSLQQLFQREKGRSANDDDAAFVKMSSKTMDMNDIFEEQIAKSTSDAKQDGRDRTLAIKEHKQLTKSLDNCQWCIDSKYMLKHLIITMDSRICLSLPHHASLTDGHCILTPLYHTACQLQLDEDVWDRLKMFKKALCKMFREQNQYPIFFEIYKSRHKFSHMKLECVPLPRDSGETAPMYFKKALLECETEWSVNKKVIDLKQKDVRQSVPNGLSYFMVEFESGGYAHVIEDEQIFPKNFAEEIIGGMLDLHHDLWRKPRKENFDQQREKVMKFTETWKTYNFGIEGVKD